jgi:hypothetical protein
MTTHQAGGAHTGALMTLRTLFYTLALMASTAAFATLKAGDPAPAFSAPASLAGKPFTYSLKESLAKDATSRRTSSPARPTGSPPPAHR